MADQRLADANADNSAEDDARDGPDAPDLQPRPLPDLPEELQLKIFRELDALWSEANAITTATTIHIGQRIRPGLLDGAPPSASVSRYYRDTALADYLGAGRSITFEDAEVMCRWLDTLAPRSWSTSSAWR